MKTKKTAAIYNRWVFTLGGGEQVAFAYAEALRDLGYETTLLTHKKVDISVAEKKMNVDLNKISITYLPLQESKLIARYSEQYDVFINTSYLDYFPNRSKKGMLSVFFPGEIYLSPYEYIKRRFIIPSFRSFFLYPVEYDGFSFDEYKNKKVHKWLGSSSQVLFNTTGIHAVLLELYFPTFAFSYLEQLQFKLNDTLVTPVEQTYNHEKNTVSITLRCADDIKKLSITSPKAGRAIALIQLTIPNIRYYLYNLFKSFFPKWEMRLHGGAGVTTLSELQSYQKIITISEFCKYWIREYWGLDSEILYPPVNTHSFTPAREKKNWITHIGRFFVTGHSKKQLDLIRVFKEIVDAGSAHNWELHFVGSVHDGKKHQEYFDACVIAAAGYPIFFHVGVPFTELNSILSHSKLYWHATGLDENQNANPVLMEHFGITTVEAMAAGCVPIVINAGGQPEIITPESGFIWNNRKELKEFTVQLIQDDQLRRTMMKAATARSQYFSREMFKERFKALLSDL